VIAVVGSGGKTSAMHALAGQLTQAGHSVVITTTTKIHPPEDSSRLAQTLAQAKALSARHRLVWAGIPQDGNKMTGIPHSLPALAQLFDYVLLEADGARRHPLKMADHSHEPVLPAGIDAVVAVAGLDGIGQSVAQAVHRPELACEALGVRLEHLITPQDVGTLLCLSYDPAYVILNKADTPQRQRLAQAVAQTLPQARCIVTSFQAWGLAEER
jgi:probable selenium-dependent hydroxylase accessory protein YqeC